MLLKYKYVSKAVNNAYKKYVESEKFLRTEIDKRMRELLREHNYLFEFKTGLDMKIVDITMMNGFVAFNEKDDTFTILPDMPIWKLVQYLGMMERMVKEGK